MIPVPERTPMLLLLIPMILACSSFETSPPVTDNAGPGAPVSGAPSSQEAQPDGRSVAASPERTKTQSQRDFADLAWSIRWTREPWVDELHPGVTLVVRNLRSEPRTLNLPSPGDVSFTWEMTDPSGSAIRLVHGPPGLPPGPGAPPTFQVVVPANGMTDVYDIRTPDLESPASGCTLRLGGPITGPDDGSVALPPLRCPIEG